METELMKDRRDRMNKSNKKWKARVINTAIRDDKGMQVITHYNSEQHKIGDIIHKVELDLMTNLENGFIVPIAVQIMEDYEDAN